MTSTLSTLGLAVVPLEITEDMAAEMECQFSTEDQYSAMLSARPTEAEEVVNELIKAARNIDAVDYDGFSDAGAFGESVGRLSRALAKLDALKEKK